MDLIETRLTDFHKLVITVMKMHFSKAKWSVITYFIHKTFDKRKFVEDFTKEFETQNRNLKNWRMIFPTWNGVLKKHSLGKRYLRANHKTFINTESWLGQNLEIASLKTDAMKVDTYLKNKKIKPVKQWKNENQYFESLSESKITQKSFWKTVQSFYLQQE